MVAQSYSLNLSPRYAANWGSWEVAREVICNAIDASPDGMKVVPVGADELRVTTPTVPDVSELFIIGEGTKAVGGDTIGQFGEGLKLAALVATRSGGGLTLNLPGKCVTFCFEKVMGVDVLHASVEDNPLHTEGYEAVIHMTNITMAFAGKFLENRKEGPHTKAVDDRLQVFSKGVYVAHLETRSIWDWNLLDIKINRDRSMVQNWEVGWEIGKWMQTNLTESMADELIRHPATIEADDALAHHHCGKIGKLLPNAFKREYGDSACLASGDPETDLEVTNTGRRVVTVGSDGLDTALSHNGIARADTFTRKKNDYDPVDVTPYLDRIKRLRALDAIIDAPLVKVCVFANTDERLQGFADSEERTIWLSEGVFSTGNELGLTSAYLHEMAHIMSGASDATKTFEYAQTMIAGRLGVHALATQMEASA